MSNTYLHKEHRKWSNGFNDKMSMKLRNAFWRWNWDIGEMRALRIKKRIESLKKTDEKDE